VALAQWSAQRYRWKQRRLIVERDQLLQQQLTFVVERKI
jgi:hypothetical protein